jgi:hypothetical protein
VLNRSAVTVTVSNREGAATDIQQINAMQFIHKQAAHEFPKVLQRFILALPGKVLQVFSFKMFPQATQIHVAARAANMGSAGLLCRFRDWTYRQNNSAGAIRGRKRIQFPKLSEYQAINNVYNPVTKIRTSQHVA